MRGVSKTGSFTQDQRGRWYVNFQAEVVDKRMKLQIDFIYGDLKSDRQYRQRCCCDIRYSLEEKKAFSIVRTTDLQMVCVPSKR